MNRREFIAALGGASICEMITWTYLQTLTMSCGGGRRYLPDICTSIQR